MKHYKTQHGATLIIILIIILAIMSITAVGFEMSMLEFKNTTRLQATTIDFYRAENCLHQATQIIYVATTPPKVKNYSMLDFSQLSPSWWDTNAYRCAKNLWSYTQLLTDATHDGYTFYHITVYSYPHQLLQATVGKLFGQSLPTIISWRYQSI
jgi:hypothetical protein